MWNDIEFLKANFIPVALDNWYTENRPDAEGRFNKRLAKGGSISNSLRVATPNGETLSGDPKEGLKRWRSLPEAERRKLDDMGPYDDSLDRVPPPGGLIVDVFSRGLTSDAAGALCIYRNEKAHLTRESNRDHLWLKESEWRSLVPAGGKTGDQFPVSESVAERISRFHLVDLVRIGGNGQPRRREDVQSRELKLTVLERTPERARLRLDGAVKQQTFTRFDIVALAESGHFDECTGKNRPLGIAFRLSRGDRPADRVWPYFLTDPEYFIARQ